MVDICIIYCILDGQFHIHCLYTFLCPLLWFGSEVECPYHLNIGLEYLHRIVFIHTTVAAVVITVQIL